MNFDQWQAWYDDLLPEDFEEREDIEDVDYDDCYDDRDFEG